MIRSFANMENREFLEVTTGEILREEFLKPLGITPYRLAKETGMPATRVADLLAGRRGITADTALRLGRFFNVEPDYWMRLQATVDLRAACFKLGDALEQIRPWPRPDLEAVEQEAA